MGQFFQTVGEDLLAILRVLYTIIRWMLQNILRPIAREILRRAQRVCFGNWRRAFATIVVVSLLAASHYPQQLGPIAEPIVGIIFCLIAIRIMVHPLLSIFGGGGRNNNRRH